MWAKLKLPVHAMLWVLLGLLFFPVIAQAQLRCNDCHGSSNPVDNRPLDDSERNIDTGGFRGNHRTHMSPGADALSCSICHPGSTAYKSGHRNGQIKLGGNINNSPVAAVYNNRTSAFPQTATPILGSCSNVNCHFEEPTPLWGSDRLTAPVGCSICHKAPPTDGSHPSVAGPGKKHFDYYGAITSCTKCHPDHLAASNPFGHVTSSGKRSIALSFATPPNSGGSYSGNPSYPLYLPSGQSSHTGSCSDLYCHSSGGGSPPNQIPSWGGGLPGDCTGCHGGNALSASPISSGSHSLHVTPGYSCGRCHGPTVGTGDDRTVLGYNAHVDGSKTVAFSDGGGYTAETKTCSGTSCHGIGTPSWGSSTRSPDCTGCHQGNAFSARPISSGKHAQHVNQADIIGTNYACGSCHSGTVGVGDDRIITDSTRHADGIKTVIFSGGGSFASGSCSATTCHRAGNDAAPQPAPPGWADGPLGCNGCHGTGNGTGAPDYTNGGAGTPLANSHGKHVFEPADCEKCHSGTTTSGTAITRGVATHTDGAVNISFNGTRSGYGATWDESGKSCSATYCHGPGTPAWGGSLPADCSGCHGGDATAAARMATGKHPAHMSNYSTLGEGNGLGCAACHRKTVDTNRHAISSSHANRFVEYSGSRAGTIGTAGSGQCANSYCHSTGQRQPQFWNMTTSNWYSGRTLGCDGCHGTIALPNGQPAVSPSVAGEPVYSNTGPLTVAANSHEKHVSGAGITDSTGCARCHAATVNAAIPNRLRNYSTLHLDGRRDVTFTAAMGGNGVQGRYSSTTGQCLNTYCHGTVSVHWGSSALTCTACHSAENSGFTATAAGSHARHYQSELPPAAGSYASMPPGNSGSSDRYRFTCTSCHAPPATHAGGVADPASGASAQVYFGYTSTGLSGTYRYVSTTESATDNGFRWTRGECSNVYCHSNGAPFDKPGDVKTVTWGGAGEGCTGCHNGPGADTGLSGRHGKHTGSPYAFTCERCHRSTVTGNDTISDKSRHVNKAKDVAFREGGSYAGDRGCSTTYCHSDGRGHAPRVAVKWSDTSVTMTCASCHGGTGQDSTQANCDAVQGVWSSARQFCTPPITMSSNGHERLVGRRWIRKYPCSYCHYETADADGNVIDPGKHVNGSKNVAIAPRWAIVGKPAPSYDTTSKQCNNIYCHSDGTNNPETVRLFGWTQGKTECNTCHGHPQGGCSKSDPLTNSYCHDGRTDSTGKVWTLPAIYGNRTSYRWPAGEEWKAANPMFPNQGAGTDRANSHMRHTETNFTCDRCHAATIAIANGTCIECHADGYKGNKMSENAHLNPDYHVNKNKDVVFKNGGSYNPVTKTCANTSSSCHAAGTDPQWGGSVNSAVTCLSCHGTTDGEVDNFGFTTSTTKATINLTQWATSGHGRPATAGPYPGSGNPAANFPGNPCWYCHDNNVIHNDKTNVFRLRKHQQFNNRFEKECVYCHMIGLDAECLSCHSGNESLAPKLDSSAVKAKHNNQVKTGGCLGTACHDTDARLHKSGAGFWKQEDKDDVKNQYLMMGVCLKCHDDDTGGKCASCHPTTPRYSLGFKPFSTAVFIKPQKARASSVHFGYKHNRAYVQEGVWKGGKFCWDCHDPHGDDGNIYMIQNRVATTTEGIYGIPQTRADVEFTKKQSGLDYARIVAPYNGICNVCHASGSQHYRSDSGDGHNASRVCTTCHEHRFTDSHANNQPCNSCHMNKPVPRHSGFGLPRDCTKCHAGTIGMRMDVMGQMKANSHHVQGVTVTNRHCYACHWESTPEGLIDVRHHEGYNYKNYSSARNAKVDLVVWRPGYRPGFYNTTTAVHFQADRIGTPDERAEVAKLNDVCIGCHNDQNNDIDPFNDCKTPRQYAWDGLSVAARYSQAGTTSWGKYNSVTYPNANRKDTVVKALSAHGNSVANKGGYSQANGVDTDIPNTRDGGQNVQCFDCHSSHGSKVVGVTSSYVTFNGTHNGANLKETQAGKGGYAMSYKASANTEPGAVNPYNAGAGQCFDCHSTPEAGTTPWGYQSTFGATEQIKGYFDSAMFGGTSPWTQPRFDLKKNKPVIGGHLKAGSFLNHSTSVANRINGLCTPCHDPHGVSPALAEKQAYAVPLLKGTWMTSPYREDGPQMQTDNPPGGGPAPPPTPSAATDQSTFNGGRVTENDDTFAGLCLRCHNKENLTSGPDKSKPWKSVDRIHQSVKGWGVNDQHSYTCSKCHTPHTSGLPRLMVTNCLDLKHRGGGLSGGSAGWNSGLFVGSGPAGPDGGNGSYPRGFMQQGVNCHPGSWPDNSWNRVTPW